MASRVIVRVLIVLLLSLLGSSIVYAQYNIQHQAPIVLERGQENILEFTVPGITQSDVQQALIFYRYDGDFGYQQQEIALQGGRFRTLFSVDNNNASSLEYYFELTLSTGETLYFPDNLPSENPVAVEIVEELEQQQKKRLDEVDFSILSPTPGGGVTGNSVVIALALFYDTNALDPGEFKLYLDHKDVTDEADTSAYYISYVPKGVRPGRHSISLEYETETETFLVTEWEFSVVAPGEVTSQQLSEGYFPQGQVELTGRNQVIAGDVNNAYTGRTRVSGQYGLLKYSLSGYLTSQENQRLQPQNRYEVNLSLGKWWSFELGHVYPFMSKFTISGRRVHGVNTSLHLLDEKLNFQFIYGELDRKITNRYDSLVVRDIVDSQGRVVDNNYYLTYQEGGRGTFRRKITGGRIGFGNEQKFQMGFHALKIQDDTTSIFNVRDYRDILNSNVSLNNNLSPVHKDSLTANPDLLEIRGSKVRPRDNIVAGTDLKLGFNNNRIRFESEGVISALNNNIYGGPLDASRADDLGFDIDQGTLDLLESISWIIIVNENMSTLPLDVSEDEEGDLSAEPFFPTSILAGNSELSVRYPSNNFSLQYRWIGPNFNSLANSTIRRDVAGFTLRDRLNLLSNQIYLTLGYENLRDNVTGANDATTKTITYRTNASWYPIDRDLPRISAGLRYRTRDNGIDRENPFISEDLVNAAVRNITIQPSSQDTLVTSTPRSNYTVNLNTSITQQFEALNARNDVSVSLNNMKTTDEVFAYGEVASTAFSLNMTSRFLDAPLETQFGFTHNNTKSGSGQNHIKITGFYVGGDMRFLENKLNVNGRIAITHNKTLSRLLNINNNNTDENRDDYYELSDDPEDAMQNTFQTYVLQAGARYNIDEYHAFVFDANLTNVSGSGRANDRIVQLRYIFRF